MRITHYAVRDLHAIDPDSEKHPVWDVVGKTDDGTCYYSDELFGSEAEARAFIEGQIETPYGFGYWEDNKLEPHQVRVAFVDWVEVPANSARPKDYEASPCVLDPDNYWVNDETGERIYALNGERTPAPVYVAMLSAKIVELRASLNTLADETIRCTAELNDNGEFPTDTCPADLFTLAHEAKEVATKK